MPAGAPEQVARAQTTTCASTSIGANGESTGDTNGSTDIFLRDRQTGTTVRVDVGVGGGRANFGGESLSISGDGRFLSFESYSTNLAAGDTNGFGDVFLLDRLNGTTEKVSLGANGSQGNQNANGRCQVSSSGRTIALQSDASDLVYQADANGTTDIFVRDRGASWDYPPFCYGDGTGAACPCANTGQPGHGCDNSAATGGAVLVATGAASLSADTLHFTSSNEKPTATSILLQGTTAVNPVHYGDGLRCVGGSLRRLFTHSAVGGVVTVPQGSDHSVSAQSVLKGGTIPIGSTRYYQVYDRDPVVTFCPTPSGDAFNISDAVVVPWGG